MRYTVTVRKKFEFQTNLSASHFGNVFPLNHVDIFNPCGSSDEIKVNNDLVNLPARVKWPF